MVRRTSTLPATYPRSVASECRMASICTAMPMTPTLHVARQTPPQTCSTNTTARTSRFPSTTISSDLTHGPGIPRRPIRGRTNRSSVPISIPWHPAGIPTFTCIPIARTFRTSSTLPIFVSAPLGLPNMVPGSTSPTQTTRASMAGSTLRPTMSVASKALLT